MYEQFYGLKRSPFSTVPDPDLLFLSPHHQRALAMLEYALMSRAGFCVVTGDVGAGKTTLIRRLLQKSPHGIEIGLVSNTTCESFEELLQWILLAFDQEYRGQDKVGLYDQLVRYLIDRFRRGTPVTLIVDEAQNLAPRMLEQLRMLSNLNTERGQVLQTILIGQPELWDLLRRPELQQLAQRVTYDYFLGPLENVELTKQYVRHRIGAVGGDPALFEDETFDAIFKATRGVPRLVNLLCDTALVYGYAEQAPRIGLRLVEQVLKDKANGISPIGHRAPPTRDEPAHHEHRQSSEPATGAPPRRRPRGDASTIERAVAKMSKDVKV
jgi:type II secretory pathway predicted ATPase ExeA